MTDREQMLRAAVEDNILWCSAVCAVHGSEARRSRLSWTNLVPSPPFYPNIITAARGSQVEVVALIGQLRARHPSLRFGIKDSFCDLALEAYGFEPIVDGDWYARLPLDLSAPSERGWAGVASPEALADWEAAWRREAGRRVFTAPLLADRRIRFWSRREAGRITAGFVSFQTAFSIGISNWFSDATDGDLPAGALATIAATFPGMPVVSWSSQEPRDMRFLSKLAPMRVWLARA